MVTQGLQTAFYPPRILLFPQRFMYQAEIKLYSKGGGSKKQRTNPCSICCGWTRAHRAGQLGACNAPWRPLPRESREIRRAVRGAGALLGGEAPSCSCAERRRRAGPALRERPGQRPPPPRGAAWTPTITAGSSQVEARGAGLSGEGVGHGRARGFGGTPAEPWP